MHQHVVGGKTVCLPVEHSTGTPSTTVDRILKQLHGTCHGDDRGMKLTKQMKKQWATQTVQETVTVADTRERYGRSRHK